MLKRRGRTYAYSHKMYFLVVLLLLVYLTMCVFSDVEFNRCYTITYIDKWGTYAPRWMRYTPLGSHWLDFDPISDVPGRYHVIKFLPQNENNTNQTIQEGDKIKMHQIWVTSHYDDGLGYVCEYQGKNWNYKSYSKSVHMGDRNDYDYFTMTRRKISSGWTYGFKTQGAYVVRDHKTGKSAFYTHNFDYFRLQQVDDRNCRYEIVKQFPCLSWYTSNNRAQNSNQKVLTDLSEK